MRPAWRIATVLLLLLAPLLAAQALSCGGHGDADSLLVAPLWLAAHLRDPAIRIVAVGPAGFNAGFNSGHIPGAQWLALPPSPQWLGETGIGPATRVIVYQPQGIPVPAARALVLLDALGLGARVALLDGGLPAWRAAGLPLERGPPRAVPAAAPSPCSPATDVLADRAFVAAHLHQPGVALVDARLPAYFSGAATEDAEPPGHIPGAINLPDTALATPDGHLLPPAALATRFRAAGIRPGQLVLAYCHSGNRASLLYLAARLLGYDARLYLGSWRDWSAPR